MTAANVFPTTSSFLRNLRGVPLTSALALGVIPGSLACDPGSSSTSGGTDGAGETSAGPAPSSGGSTSSAEASGSLTGGPGLETGDGTDPSDGDTTTSWASTGFEETGTTGDVELIPCSERLGEFEVVSEFGNAITGSQLMDRDFPPNGTFLEFGPAINESCLGTGSAACVPEGTPLPAWNIRVLLFEDLDTGVFELAQGIHIEPDDTYPLVQYGETTTIEPECFPSFSSASVLGQLEIVDVDDELILGYICDSAGFPGIAWEFVVNRC